MLSLIPVLGRTQYLVLPSNLAQENLEKEIFAALKDLPKEQKVRLIWDKTAWATAILQTLEKIKTQNFSGLHFAAYETISYRLDLNQLELHWQNFPATSWQNYQQDFVYQRVNSFRQPEFEVLEDFCITSHGSQFIKENGQTILQPIPSDQAQIRAQLPRALENVNNFVYLVAQKNQENGESGQKNNYVGCFDLVKVNSQEMQLHYTSGKASNFPIFQGKKMPILVAAMLDILQNLKSENPNLQYLTFSNKDIETAPLYRGVGFEQDRKRQTLLLVRK